METTIILQLAGFVICFILLFVFIAKYHQALEEDVQLEEEVAGLDQVTVTQPPVFKPRAALLQSTQAPAALEVADLKEQVKTLHYHLEEFKATTQKQEADMANQISRLEARLSAFEQEVSKLQPTLLRVIEELEHIKGGEESSSQADGEPFAADRPHTSPVLELPEEELKF